jgi:hypothetical protein
VVRVVAQRCPRVVVPWRAGLQATVDVQRHPGHPVHELVQAPVAVRREFAACAPCNDIALAGDGGSLTSGLFAGSIFGHDASIPAGSHALSRRLIAT